MEGFPRVLGIIQAGGEGSRMDVLTRERAKPALSFAGSYKLIDFPLSSFAGSGIPDVWVSVSYLASTLDPYIAQGRPWDLDRTRGGYRRVVPEEGWTSAESGFAAGNADNLVQLADAIADFAADVLVVMSADHVFTLDLRPVIRDHVERGAECTIVTAQVGRSEARHNAVVEVSDDGRVSGFAYKPDRPAGTTVATEIFLYDPGVLLGLLARLRAELSHADDEGSSGLGDFGEHLLPALVDRGRTFATPMTGYWRDVGRPEVYLQAHRDLLRGKVDVFDRPGIPVLTRWPEKPPARVRPSGEVDDALLGAGVVVHGTVRRSVLGPGVVVERGAVVEDAVIGADVVIAAGAAVRTSIIDDGCRVGRGARVGGTPASTRLHERDIAILGRDTTVAASAEVPAGARLEPGSSA
ncbi:NTP transferase domain-containing protein [Nostocoides sp. F2B08]|uniref:glucose-1-phosphate adenylyltransferase family protein n=1 Tax=Nostocoides sp. F2B08 TaxID=2653936 RepID=UPI001263417A|nr:sugar phosphate nucleotidyltransferase [Tetrasphaera sp. F2B08]KAB7745257.1 NTP transferase domain-containing protein [Tetrasphaera sp. F2B08]